MNYIMSPSELEVLLHYYYTPVDIENRSDLQSRPVGRFKELGLLAITDTDHRSHITERGKAYVEAILSLPLPVQIWVTPNETST